MEKKVLYYYGGPRIRWEKKNPTKRFAYYERLEDGNWEVWFFQKLLLGYETIGTGIACISVDDKAVKGAKPAGEQADDEDIAQWTASARAAKIEWEEIIYAKKEKDASIEILIEQLQESISHLRYSERKKVALYIFGKLTGT